MLCLRRRQVTKQNDVIRRLQTDIHQVETAADESMRRTRVDAEKQEAAERKNSEGKLAKQQQELAQVQAQYANVLAKHRSGEQALRKVGGLSRHSELGCIPTNPKSGHFSQIRPNF